MSFNDVKDQYVPVRLLQNIVRRGRIPNGLLFWGPGGVGKSLTAMQLAKAVNCESRGGEACDTCLSCRKTMHGNHPDVKIVTPSGKVRNISVDSINFINDLAAYRPFEAGWRVIIIEDADRMGEPAQNHFLKTLEEPPSATLFVLLSEYPRALLPTIRSRCQQVRFGALRPETVAALLLRERKLTPAAAEAIAAVSQGQMSRALDLVDTGKRDVVLEYTARLESGEDPLLLSEEFVQHLKAQQEALKAALFAQAAEDGGGEAPSKEERDEQEKALTAFAESRVRQDQMEYLYLLEAWYRDALVYQATQGTGRILNRDQEARLKQTPQAPAGALTAIEKAWLYIERNLSMDRVFRDLFFALTP